MPKLRQLGVAVLFHEPGDVVAPAPAAGLALDREGRDAEVREGVAWSLIERLSAKPDPRHEAAL
jgi:hypothetical protein